MQNCFWCGEKLGMLQHTGEHEVGGVQKKFHIGMFRDCRNEFMKWQRSHQPNPNLQLLEIVKQARRVC